MNNSDQKALKGLELFYVSYDAMTDYPIILPVGNTKAGRATSLHDAFRAEKRCLNGLEIKAVFTVGEASKESMLISKGVEKQLQKVFASVNRKHKDTGNDGENYWIEPTRIIEWLETNTDFTRIF